MGSLGSKLLKHNCTDAPDENSKTKEMIHIMDPRSPTGEIIRTPITIEKEQDEKTNNPERKPSLRKQALANTMRLDPRSPSDNINRTPIFLDSTPVHKQTKQQESESPNSIYSSNLSDIGSLSELMTPLEPSVNVSGFENDESFSESLDDKPQVESSNITKTPLKVSNKPSTLEARKILNEILSTVDYDDDFIDKRPKLKLSIHCDNYDVKQNEKKKDKLKCRTPLSNITLSANSPNQINSLKKQFPKTKIFSDGGLENTKSPQRHIVEWDKDKTVII